MNNLQVKIFWFVVLVSSLSSFALLGQTDSLLAIQKLGTEELVFHEEDAFNQKVISASQSLQEVKDLPFTIHVITREEILKNGYVTLVDALKMVPGIRISQPGSAFEGETFLMRGLKGNAYTKILVNGINFKPSVVSGMPIGAQLPIQQAERIEIIYGPVAALYGADASAGVINIILKKSERPVFVQAGLQSGGYDYTGLSLMFGGRLGKTKNTLDYTIYANNTDYQDLNIRHTSDPQLFNSFNTNYNDGFFIGLSPNYQGSTIDSIALIAKLPHSSRVVGAHIAYKSMELSINNMYRRDHSSLGLNPGAVSYTNPLNYIGERILNAHLKFEKQYNKWGFKTEASHLYFKMDNRSSTTYVFNLFALALTTIDYSKSILMNGGEDDFETFLSLLENSLNNYTSGSRYSYAASNNNQISQTFNFLPSENFELTAGLSLNTYDNTPLTEYSPISLNEFTTEFERFNIPVDSVYELVGVPFIPESTDDVDVSSYIQSYITLDKWNIIAGAQYYYHSNFGRAVNPRIAILYQLLPEISLRGFYGTSFRRPPQFFETTNYALSVYNDDVVREKRSLSPEKTSAYELGLRWHSKDKFNADVVLFHTSTENLLFYNLESEDDEINDLTLTAKIGYNNYSDTKSNLFGIQSSFNFNNIWNKVNTSLHIQVAKISESNPVINEFSFQGNENEQPRIMLQSRTSYSPHQKVTLTLDGVYMGKFRNKGFGDRALSERSYFTLDALIQLQLNRTFSTFFKVNNVFNNEYAGIDAYGTVDDLNYNPQQKSFIRFGVNYILE